MVEKLRSLAVTYREQLSYLLVGCQTTLINYAVYALLTYGLHVHYIAGNIAAWVVAVTFAYFANGAFVYRSTEKRGLTEAGAFFLSRLFSLALEAALLELMIKILHLDELLAKLAVSGVTIVVNYLTGKLVFKKR